MYEIVTSDDGGRTWTTRAVSADLDRARDAARDEWVFHELAAVVEDGDVLFEHPTPRGQVDGELPRWPVRF